VGEHDWIKSPLGHGETMCRNCKVTNREAAVLGMDMCDHPAAKPRKDDTPEAVMLLQKWCGIFFGRNADMSHMDRETYVAAHTKMFMETADWLKANGYR